MSQPPDVQAHLDRIERDGFTIVASAFARSARLHGALRASRERLRL
jgi:hypothetical protein